MKQYLLCFLFVVAGLAGLSQHVLAHHSETAEYDPSDQVTVTGVLTKVEWKNPHVWLYIDVREENGDIAKWAFSTAPPGFWMRRGVFKDNLKIGSEVTMSGSRAWDGSNNASGRSMKLSDGTNLFTAPEG
jgi:hypothetical protein